MNRKQSRKLDKAIDRLLYLEDHPWSGKWTMVEKLREARSAINLILKSLAREDR